MSSLSNPAWQSQYLRRYGHYYSSPKDVMEEFERVELAARVSGRPDIAEELKKRVDKRLCEKYATVLMALKQLRSPHWLEADPPDFNIPVETGPILEQVEIEADQWGESSDESVSQSASLDEDSLSEVEVELDFDDVVISRSPSPVRQIEPKLVPKFDPEKPASNGEILREGRLAMLGWSTRSIKRSSSLSDNCLSSVMADFETFAENLSNIRIQNRNFAKIADDTILSSKPRSPLEALVIYRSLSNKLPSFEKDFSLWIIGINLWLNGKVSPVVYEDTSVPLRSAWAHRFRLADLPKELHHPNLLKAGLCAWFARHLSLEPPKVPEIVFESQWQYHQAILARTTANQEWLMTDHTKKGLLDTWHKLAGVFLAQDPSTLNALYHGKTEYPEIPEVDEVYLNVFIVEDLHAFWGRVVEGFGHDVRVWLDLRATAQAIADALRTKKDLSYFDICNI